MQLSDYVKEWAKRNNVSEGSLRELGVQIKLSAAEKPMGFLRRVLESFDAWEDKDGESRD